MQNAPNNEKRYFRSERERCCDGSYWRGNSLYRNATAYTTGVYSFPLETATLLVPQPSFFLSTASAIRNVSIIPRIIVKREKSFENNCAINKNTTRVARFLTDFHRASRFWDVFPEVTCPAVVRAVCRDFF